MKTNSMEENENILTSYCFLAALTERQSDVFKGVFIPIVKRSLSYYNLNGKTSGSDADIQEVIKELYEIDIPILVVRHILKAIEAGMSRREKANSGFNLLDNGKFFEVKEYAFLDLEERYKQGNRDVNFLQQAFHAYLIGLKEVPQQIPSFAEFINVNKNKITSFFSGKKIGKKKDVDKSFIHHVNYLEFIEANHHHLYDIAENLYLGSLVASLLEAEIDFSAKFPQGETYYLDTQIVLKALDLQGEADSTPIIEILDLIKSVGGKLKVFDITLEEINFILSTAINNYNSQYPTTSINDACIRRNKNKAWLITLQGKIEKELEENLKIIKEDIPPKKIEEYKKTKDLSDLKERRFKEANAVHDVSAYLFVREKRGGAVRVHQNANSWFLTANKDLLFFNLDRINPGCVPEITLPDTLACLLWLKNPLNLVKKVKKIGLSELIALTIRDEIASKELINEFDKNLKATEDISKEDYEILLSSIAYQSAKNIGKLNKLIYEGKRDEFNVEAHILVDKERNRRASQQQVIKSQQDKNEKIESENIDLLNKINDLEHQFAKSEHATKSTTTQLEELAAKLDKQGKYVKRFLIWLGVFLVALIIGLFLYQNTASWDTANKIIAGIIALSGVWSFGSFVINLLKALKIIN